MKNYQEQLTNYLPEIEKYLTSVLLEETKIEITSFETVETGAFLESMDKDDIFILTRDEVSNSDVICILDKHWFAILSSIMLGIDESSFNEVTKDLLKKFSSELSTTLSKKMTEDGFELDLLEMEVLTLKHLEEKLSHTEYFFGLMEVEGLSDDKIKAAALFGNPEAVLVKEEPEEEIEEEVKDESGFEEKNSEQMEKIGTPQEVISGRYIEFEDFDETTPAIKNGDGNSMDLLKDVEMDVSVELGRIELPLGKVLQLAKGSVIELEKLAGEPVDILVNGQRIAHGEVVVIDEHFGVRISNLITTRQRLAKLS
ncbi:MAG: flagellar motor switch protein FliN [Balneola sp.]|jgi:flagellar motor switch protein FliN|nr:flagellar motor switch protein FliN [Balneola sp.]MBE79173.1 flagellar motor switch protein FliN [Balneola sp.]|tara:strand:- start:1172 stop:2110 length:939 start_codon:yes stop_codon:yes gene_type:complete